MPLGKKTLKKSRMPITMKAHYNPASDPWPKKRVRIYGNDPRTSPANPGVMRVGYTKKQGSYGNPKAVSHVRQKYAGKLGPSEIRKGFVKQEAKDIKKYGSGYKPVNAVDKILDYAYKSPNWSRFPGMNASIEGKNTVMKKKSASSASAVAYPYSPGGYGNLGLAGSSASSVANSDLSDPYAALKYMQDSNTALNVYMNEENNRFAADQARINRQWQESMANSAHQREVKDLQAAGLNPVLSANAGAAVPAGSAAGSSNFVGADSSAIHAIAQIVGAAMSSSATTTAAALNANASMYQADQSRAASQYGADQNLKGTKFTATHGKGTKWIGDWKYGVKYIDRLAKKYHVDIGKIYKK